MGTLLHINIVHFIILHVWKHDVRMDPDSRLLFQLGTTEKCGTGCRMECLQSVAILRTTVTGIISIPPLPLCLLIALNTIGVSHWTNV